MALAITNENYNEVTATDLPVVIDFWAEWCGPCRMLSPIIEEMAAEYEGKAVIGKVDVDEQGELAMRYGVMSIPTVIFFKDGKEIHREVGALPKDIFVNVLNENL